jgi:hypothetical protein
VETRGCYDNLIRRRTSAIYVVPEEEAKNLEGGENRTASEAGEEKDTSHLDLGSNLVGRLH